MANFLDKIKVPTALTKHTRLDLSHTHITTSNFMETNICMIRHNIPKEKLEVDVNAFARLDYMILPSLGHVKHHMHAFFVPFRTVMPAFTDFITNSPHVFPNASSSSVGQIVTSTPLIKNVTIVNYLVATGTTTGASSSSYDFAVTTGTASSPVNTYYKHTAESRRAWKLLLQLGYKPSFDIRSDGEGYTTSFSALPLLCFVKVYVDWYFPASYLGDSEYLYLMSLTKHDDATPFEIQVSDLQLIFRWTQFVQYDSDYFTSAFDNPVGPNSGGDSRDILINDVTVPNSEYRTRVRQLSNGTPAFQGVNSSGTPGANPYNLSQFALMTLHKVSDYMQRHRLAGARSLERYLSRFGVTLEADKLNRSYYLGKHSIDLQVQDIMSTSDTVSGTSGAYIGQYAGKGIIRGNNAHFSCSSDEYGLFIVLSSIVPVVGYPQGFDRHILNKDRLSFFTPEFDGYGCQPILKGELYMANTQNISLRNQFTGVFGFTGRYAEYKVAKDKLTGDFQVPTRTSWHMSSSAFHMMRLMNASDMSSDSLVHSLEFMRGSDASQFNRIFYDVAGADNGDHFTIQYLINATAKAPCSSLFDVFDFDEDGGRDVTLEANGVRVN